ncbi:MAG: site-specific integrase, partial [Thermoguttaceae bacterium]|nr:site-specific integrase [Thermoguttaceae bacterium]
MQAGTYTAKYRDGSGIVRKVATGCRDRTAAESVLAELERRADKVRSGLRTVAEDAAVEHQAAPLATHVSAYLVTLEAEGTSPAHRANVERILKRLAADCRFNRLADLEREALERWLVSQEKAGMGGRTRNTYRAAAVAFANWCVETGRLLVNPFARVAKAAEDADPRRQRRSLTEAELTRLLDVARRRPLEDRLTVYRGRRKGQQYARLRPEVRQRLERLGRERALIYKTLVLTGLRKGELASITIGHLNLDTEPPYLTLDAANEKNREGSTIPLRADLAADLRQWIAEKAADTEEARRQAPTISIAPGRRADGLPDDAPLFNVPDKLVRILNRDLAAAGIPKRDDRGRTVDVHALRHTFGTLLSKGGVAPRTAQAAMRHSKIDLTMNVYTDPRLLDVAGAISSLPSLPLPTGQQEAANVVSRTGTEDSPASPLVPLLVLATGKPCISGAIPGKTAENRDHRAGDSPIAV